MTGRATEDRASLLMVKVKEGADPAAVTGSLRERFPSLAINSIADLVAAFRVRMLYFRQLSYILGTVSLLVTVLLVATLLTITVNERLGEIVTLRAIGVSRGRVVRQVMAEGAALTVIGAVLGVILGLATARYLDASLTSFPGLPAAFSFFVPRTDAIALAGATLLVTGTLAGLYPAWRAAGAPIAATLRAEAT
jgi:putative ABC transport system permease protein